jgi:hypothetical protein
MFSAFGPLTPDRLAWIISQCDTELFAELFAALRHLACLYGFPVNLRTGGLIVRPG